MPLSSSTATAVATVHCRRQTLTPAIATRRRWRQMPSLPPQCLALVNLSRHQKQLNAATATKCPHHHRY